MSDLGLQHFQEEFVHGDLSLQLDAVEVLHCFGSGLPQERKCQQKLASPAGLVLMLAMLIVLKGLMEKVL